MTSLPRTLRATGSAALASLALAVSLLGCDNTPDPDAGPADAGPVDAFVPRMDSGGGDGRVACATAADCDDGVPCTTDICAADGACRHPVDNALCDDGIFCNGVEQCDPRRGGCGPGPRQTCNDGDVCTVDRCDEEAGICRNTERDLDEDGDPDFFCAGGGDCDDRDPTVSSLLNEVCDDRIDNDCDLVVDEDDCGRPRYDTCDEPLDVSGGGFFVLNTEGAAPDYTLECRTTSRDLVASFTLTSRRSVELIAEGAFFSVALSLRTTCADRTSSLACMSGFPGVIRFPALDPGTYYVIVGASSDGEVDLEVDFADPIDPPANDSCSAPTDVSAGGRFPGTFVATADDTATTCGFTSQPDVFYTFTTTAVRDVQISAQSVTGQALNYGVRTTCDDAGSSIRCDYGAPANGVLHQLPAGTYFIVLEGPAAREVDFDLDVTFSAPTPAVAGDSCASALRLMSGVAATGSFSGAQNDHAVSCGLHYRDLVYTFDLATPSDVTLSLATGNRAGIALRTTCDDGMTPSQLRCTTGNPVSQRVRNLAAGTYYVIAENSTTSSYTLNLTATSPPTVPVEAVGNDNCGMAQVIPEIGGLFHGNTSGLTNSYLASCGGSAASRDAAFSLTLTSRSRVVASTQDSTYDTVLHVHRPSCVSSGDLYCDDNSGEGASSLIDRTLDPGTYFIIVDGFGSSSAGEYFLEVTVTPS